MRYKKFGNTGLFVSELCLGAMTFGGQDGLWGQIGQLQQEEANRLVGRALEAGVNFIDTADVYAEGRSETITGQALRDLKVARDEVVLATKVFGPTGAGPNARGNSRHHIMEGVKRSLARLAPTISTCTRSMASIRPRRSRKPFARWTTWCARAMCVMSACRTGRPGRS